MGGGTRPIFQNSAPFQYWSLEFDLEVLRSPESTYKCAHNLGPSQGLVHLPVSKRFTRKIRGIRIFPPALCSFGVVSVYLKFFAVMNSKPKSLYFHIQLTRIRIGLHVTLQLPYESINKFDLAVDSHFESGYTQHKGNQLMRVVAGVELVQ